MTRYFIHPRKHPPVQYQTLEEARKAADEGAHAQPNGYFICQLLEIRYADISIENKSISFPQIDGDSHAQVP
jgi:hypothetical protein